MRIIGLTGGIACGKSTVSRELALLGARIVDGDLLSRELTAPGGRAIPALREAFGDAIFAPDGTMDRRALGRIVFSDDTAREKLDGIMQPLLLEMIREKIREAERDSVSVCVLDMPLLYEKGLDRLCSRVWCVTLPEELQLERLMARDRFDRDAALARLRSQMPVSEKAARADTVLDNSGTEEELIRKVRLLYRQEL